MVDKDFCLSSYMAFRYTWDPEREYFPGMHHRHRKSVPLSEKTPIAGPEDLQEAIRKRVDDALARGKRPGILLSGGMDSALVASFLPAGTDAYTFSSDTGVFDADLERAQLYCNRLGLRHHRVEITFDDFRNLTPAVMQRKCGPVHSIEPQLLKAALQAREDGVDLLLIGDGADYVFGGMDKLLSQDWTYEAFVRRYIALDPALVLVHPADVYAPFRKYKKGDDGIDFQGFMDDLCTEESYSSYENAFLTAGMDYLDPYEDLVMAQPLDLQRVRRGESKYIVRELHALRYPDIPLAEKIPMPRPVDAFLRDWKGPQRAEFRQDIPMDRLTGNQKWQLWCAEYFLNLHAND